MSLTPLDRAAIRRSFERAASTYDHHAVLHREIGSRLLERIEFQRREPAVILDLGCGTGQTTRLLSEHHPSAKVIALDWAPAMLARNAHQAQLAPLCGDMHALPLAARSIDLVFSNLALQWACDLPAIFGGLRRVMKPDAMLVFSCYGPDTLTELKQAWRSVDDRQHVNDHPDMHDVGDVLVSAGFREPVMDAERLTLDYPDVMSLMRELKGLGERNVASQRFRGLTARSSIEKLSQAYGVFSGELRAPASFEIIYGTAFAPAEGQPVKTAEGDVATFSVDALKKRS